jgi:hypothetical protein
MSRLKPPASLPLLEMVGIVAPNPVLTRNRHSCERFAKIRVPHPMRTSWSACLLDSLPACAERVHTYKGPAGNEGLSRQDPRHVHRGQPAERLGDRAGREVSSSGGAN